MTTHEPRTHTRSPARRQSSPRMWMTALLLVALPVLRAAAEPPRTTPAEAGFDPAKLAEVPKRMQEFVDKKQAAGIVTLVARHGKIVAVDAVGHADVEHARPMAEDTAFWIASMTKTVAATAFMILVDEGKVSVDDPVSKHIPAFKDVKHKDGTAPKTVITIRHLLTHTSGLGGFPDKGWMTASLEEQSDTLAKAPLAFEPGSKWAYGGLTNITVVGRIIEIVSGKPFDVFLQERLFTPLGMKRTGFTPSDEQRVRIATIYKPGKDKGTLAPATAEFVNMRAEDKGRAPNPSGGLFSTAGDLAAFYAMVLAGGEYNGKRILSAKAVETMTTIATGDLTAGFAKGYGWGLGWGVVREPEGNSKALSPGTFGHGGAFGTQGWVDKKRGVVLVLLVARQGFGNSDDSLLRGTFNDAVMAAVAK